MTKHESFGYVKDGQLHLLNKGRMAEDLRQFKDCDVVITVKRRGKRSIMANSYYWAVCVKEIQLRLRELGHDLDMDETHEFLKVNFHSVSIANSQGEEIKVPGRTSEMTRDEFSEYLERIKAWAYDKLEIWIPEPNTQTQIFKVA